MNWAGDVNWWALPIYLIGQVQVYSYLCIPFQPTLFIPGKRGNNIGHAMVQDSVVLCLWVDFTTSPRDHICGFFTKDFTGACPVCT